MIAGCRTSGTFRAGVFEGHTVKYEIDEPGNGWQKDNLRDADLAWIYHDGEASILVNSRCVGTKDVSLEALTGQLFIGMTDQQQISMQKDQRSGREALETVTNLKIDGVPMVMKSYVLKKDLCVYDIILAADPQAFEAAQVGYETVKAKFDVQEREQ